MANRPIRVDKQVYERLLEMKSSYEAELGRIVSFNEALRIRFGFDPMPRKKGVKTA